MPQVVEKKYKQKYLRPDQVENYQETLESLEKMEKENRPELNVGEIRVHKKKIEKTLSEGVPQPTTPNRRDEVLARIKNLEGRIRENMPTREQMVRKPPGAVEHHRRWEAANKDDILEWKDLKRELEPESRDPDLCNVESIRPGADLNQIIPRKYYSGVDMRDGEVVQEGIADAEKIASRVAEEAVPPKPAKKAKAAKAKEPKEYPTVSCGECEKTFTGPHHKNALRFHMKSHGASDG